MERKRKRKRGRKVGREDKRKKFFLKKATRNNTEIQFMKNSCLL